MKYITFNDIKWYSERITKIIECAVCNRKHKGFGNACSDCMHMLTYFGYHLTHHYHIRYVGTAHNAKSAWVGCLDIPESKYSV